MTSRRWLATFFVLIVLASLGTAALAAQPMKALIVDGQNNHNWRETTPILKQLLEETELFTVDVATSPPKKSDMKLPGGMSRSSRSLVSASTCEGRVLSL